MDPKNLGRRDRQIMDVVFRLGRASVKDVLGGLDDPPTYSTVRAMLGKLENKGYVSHVEDGPRYLYLPSVSKDEARRTAVENLVQTFFDGSVDQAALALAKMSDTALPASTMDALAERIRLAKEEDTGKEGTEDDGTEEEGK